MKEKKKRKKHRVRKFIMILFFLLVLLFVGWYLILDSVYGKMNYREIESLSEEAYKDEGVTNILLIGNED